MSLTHQITNWIRTQVQAAGAEGLVVGLSGGVDSACVAGLCERALGRKAVVGVLLPCHSDPIDVQYGRMVARAFDLQAFSIDLGPVYDTLSATLPPTGQRLAQANLKPRLRMVTLYHVANARNYLVAGTGNKSELMVGYFTKHGDGGVDMEPLGDLYKSQVYALARELGVPQPILDRPPTAGLWPGQTDEEEMGLSYDTLERALVALSSGDEGGVDRPTLLKVRRMVDASAHKRALPPMFIQGTTSLNQETVS